MKNKLVVLKKWKSTTKSYTANQKNKCSDYSLKVLCNTQISTSCFNSLFLLFKKIFKKKSYYVYNLNKKQILSLKSLGMRMGKGKGSKKKTIYLINKGDFFFDLKESVLRTLKDFKLFIKILKKKLPFYSQAHYKKNIFINL